jgi:hypothetical protein
MVFSRNLRHCLQEIAGTIVRWSGFLTGDFVLPERLARVEIVGAGDKPTVTRVPMCLACAAALKTWLNSRS